LFFAERGLFFYLTVVAIGLTPALKISFQNVGVGDGLMYLLIVAAVAADSKAIIFIAFVLLGTWHPQQAFFIGGSYVICSAAYRDENFLARAGAAIAGLAVACAIFVAYKFMLGFEYQGRLGYMTSHMREFLVKNFSIALPVSISYFFLWWLAVRKKLHAAFFKPYVAAWFLILAVVAGLTTDVTRVLIAISMPMLLIPMRQVYLDAKAANAQELPRFSAWVIAAIVLMPIYSWSGFDIFLWPDLVKDLCKYKVFCI